MRIFLAFMLISISSMAQNVSITAHRGASGYAPENTVSSVKKALEMGVDRIEVDVQQTSDGVVIVMHDKTLDRTTNCKGNIKNMEFEAMNSCFANSGFEETFPKEKIPKLEDVFQLLDGSVEFVIEIKDGRKRYPGIEDKVVALIKKYNAQKWAIVHSFNDQVLEYLDDNYPEIRLQKLFVSKSSWLPLMLDFKLHSASLSDYHYVEAFGISRSGTNRKIVEKIHQLGQKVHVWTVNETDDIEHMLGLGVDGIITNYPDRVKPILNSLK